jgi:hypothetical protein
MNFKKLTVTNDATLEKSLMVQGDAVLCAGGEIQGDLNVTNGGMFNLSNTIKSKTTIPRESRGTLFLQRMKNKLKKNKLEKSKTLKSSKSMQQSRAVECAPCEDLIDDSSSSDDSSYDNLTKVKILNANTMIKGKFVTRKESQFQRQAEFCQNVKVHDAMEVCGDTKSHMRNSQMYPIN